MGSGRRSLKQCLSLGVPPPWSLAWSSCTFPSPTRWIVGLRVVSGMLPTEVQVGVPTQPSHKPTVTLPAPPQDLAQQPGWPETRRKMPPPLLLTRPRNTTDNHRESCDRVSALKRNTTSSWEFKRKGKIENSASQAFSVEDTGLNPGIILGGYRRDEPQNRVENQRGLPGGGEVRACPHVPRGEAMSRPQTVRTREHWAHLGSSLLSP